VTEAIQAAYCQGTGQTSYYEEGYKDGVNANNGK